MKRFTILLMFFTLLLFSCNRQNEESAANQSQSANLVPAAYEDLTNLQNNLRNVGDNVTPSVVFISTERIVKQQYMDPFDFFFGNPFDQSPRNRAPKQREFKQSALGSGVVYKQKKNKYYIITNNHVIDQADTIKVTVDKDKTYDGKVIGTDPNVDIAVVEIKTKDELSIAKFGDSDAVKVGDFAIAVGNPFGLSGTMTFGIVSALGRDNIQSDKVSLTDFIQTDAAINPGNSGGPLLNIHGEVIGINTMIYSQSGGSVGIGFAVPVNMVKSTAEQIIETGKVEHGYLGIYFVPLDDENSKQLGIKDTKHGMMITQVMDDSPAQKGGLKTGDVILTVDKKKLYDTGDLAIYISSKAPGTTVNFRILRNNKEEEIAIKLGTRDDQTFSQKENQAAEDETGMQLTALSQNVRKQYNIPDSIDGVVITAVAPNSRAAQASLKKGDVIIKVNNANVRTPADIEKFRMKDSNKSNYYLIYRDGKEYIIIM